MVCEYVDAPSAGYSQRNFQNVYPLLDWSSITLKQRKTPSATN